jgi:peptidylprolyl isomerase
MVVICLNQIKPPRSLKITDTEMGTGRPCVPGDVAVCHCVCTRRKGDVVFTSEPNDPYRIRVGGRDCYVGIEYGLIGMRVGGKRSILVPPNLTYHERKTYREIPQDAMLIYELRLVDLPEKWDAEMDSRLANQVDN